MALNLVENYDPNGRIQLLVALKNLSLINRVYSEYMREKKGKLVTVKNLVEHIEDTLAEKNGELADRRLHWFCQSALILECAVNQEACDAYYEVVLKVWIYFLESHYCMQNVLQHNVIWSDDEKTWFKQIGDNDQSLMLIASRAPDNIASDKRFKEAYRRLSGGSKYWSRPRLSDKHSTRIN